MTCLTRLEPNRTKRVRFVVIEDGLRALGPYIKPDGGDETVILRQWNGERPLAFAHRAIRRIATIERSGGSVGRATLLMAPRTDHESAASRHLLARALAAHARAVPVASSEFVFAAPGEAPAALCSELIALVEALTGEPESCRVPIRLVLKPCRPALGAKPARERPLTAPAPRIATTSAPPSMPA